MVICQMIWKCLNSLVRNGIKFDIRILIFLLGVGVAVGNAHQRVKDIAGKFFLRKKEAVSDYSKYGLIDIVTLTNYEDGVAIVLEQVSQQL